MLLLGHEHFMKIPENWMNIGLIILGLFLILLAIFGSKGLKAHFVAFTMFP